MAGGWIHLITGCMFSGKTDEMLRLIRRAEIAGRRVVLVRPSIDDRTAAGAVESRSGVTYKARAVADSGEIPPIVTGERASVVAIDEAQFFDWTITDVCEQLTRRGKRVILTGLDMDFRGEPFGPVPVLMAQAETVDKLQAICAVCGAPASRTQRLIDGIPANYDEPQILVGAKEVYQARCRRCHEVPPSRHSSAE